MVRIQIQIISQVAMAQYILCAMKSYFKSLFSPGTKSKFSLLIASADGYDCENAKVLQAEILMVSRN